jgi:hypothetical protein
LAKTKIIETPDSNQLTSVFSRERSSTGSNDCFVVLLVVVAVVVGILVL